MSGKWAAFTFIAAVLLILCTGAGGATPSNARTLAGANPVRPDGMGHDCATLSVTALTPDVSSFENKVAFQITAPPWCAWSASSPLIEQITPTQGAGSQYVTGVLPPNNSDQPRTAQFSVTSTDGVIVRTATVTQAAAVSDCTGAGASPTIVWPPGAFITVTVPAGWTWYWSPQTPLMQYNCTASYPSGVSCHWQCSTSEPRTGWAYIIASGEGRRCSIVIVGQQTSCP